jgi:thiamine pyrophosphokinase
MSVLIFANGELDEVAWIRPYLAQAAAVIAADGGARYVQRLGRPPDVIIGDLDSLPEELREADTAVTRIIAHPVDKDETDLELALLYAVNRYSDDLLIFGAFGGRVDQTLANILLLAHPALAGRRVELINNRERAWLVTSQTTLRGAVGDRVSLIPLGGDARVRETRGLRWSLTDQTLAFGPARGISNVMTAPEAFISLAAGRVLCIHAAQG